MSPITVLLVGILVLFFIAMIISAIVIFFTTGFKRSGRMMGGLYVIVGVPGSGKSYIGTSIAIQKMKEGRKVFTNFPVVYNDGDKILVTRHLEKSMLLNENMNGSVIIEDEGQKDFWSRDFKNFSKEYLMFFSSLNQHEISMYVITQHENRIDTVINDCANLFGRVEKTEIPFLDMPIWFNLTWWNSELDMQQSAYTDKVECFLAERIWFNRDIARSYDTKFFGTDKRPPYEGEDWISYYKKLGIDYQGNYDFSPITRIKVWLLNRCRDFKYVILQCGVWIVEFKPSRSWLNREFPDRMDRNLEKQEELDEKRIKKLKESTQKVFEKFGGRKDE